VFLVCDRVTVKRIKHVGNFSSVIGLLRAYLGFCISNAK